MIVRNEKTGEDITRHVLALLERRIDRAEFERRTGLVRRPETPAYSRLST